MQWKAGAVQFVLHNYSERNNKSKCNRNQFQYVLHYAEQNKKCNRNQLKEFYVFHMRNNTGNVNSMEISYNMFYIMLNNANNAGTLEIRYYPCSWNQIARCLIMYTLLFLLNIQ